MIDYLIKGNKESILPCDAAGVVFLFEEQPKKETAARQVGEVFVEAQIVVDGLGHVFKPPRGREVVALNGVTLDIQHREFVAILGPSGCGKSTLLYMLGGFIPVEQGRILVEGQPVVGPGPDRGIVFQHFALFPWRTVRQNVLYGLERAGMGRAEREECAQNYINRVGLEGFEDS